MGENRTTIVEKNGSIRHHLWQRSGYGHQLYNMEIRWVGNFSWIAQLGLCDIFYFTLLNFSLRNG